MLPSDMLHHRIFAGFATIDGSSLKRLPCPSPARDRDPLPVGQALHDRQRHGLAGTFRVWRERIQYRRDLRRLALVAPHMIDDIGLTPDQAMAEADRPFWC